MDGNLTDLTGNDYNGSALELSQQSDRFGIAGQALGFYEANHSVQLPELPLGQSSFNVMGWVRADSYGGEIFSLGSERLSGIFLHLEDNGSISFGTGLRGERAYALAPSGWFHLAADFDVFSKRARIFVNGMLQSEATFSEGFVSHFYDRTGLPFDFPFPSREVKMANNSAKGGASHAVRAQSTNFGYSEGTFSFRVNSGTAGDHYRLWVGDICVFSTGSHFQGGDHTLHYNDNGPANINYTASDGTSVTLETEDVNFSYPGDGWRTSGSAATGDDDLFEIYFAPGTSTSYQVTVGPSNDDSTGKSNYNPYDPATGLYNNIITQDLPESFSSSTITLQVETNNLGVIYGEGESSGSGESLGADPIANDGVHFVPQIITQPIMGDDFNGSLDDFRIYGSFPFRS